MGGSSKKDKARTILKGKSNYATWVPAAKMELRAEECLNGILDDEPPDPNEQDIEKRKAYITQWLIDEGETPDADDTFSSQKINATRMRWRKAALAALKEYQDTSTKALGIIYNLCDTHVQTVIGEEEVAKECWKHLEQMYKQQGFASVYEQVGLINTITYRSCNSLEEYVNKIKQIRSNLVALGHPFGDDVWSAIFINGIGDSFELLTSQLLSVDKGARSFDEVIQLTFSEELRKKSAAETGVAFKAQNKGGNNNSSSNKKSKNKNKELSGDKDDDEKADWKAKMIQWREGCATHETLKHRWADCPSNPRNSSQSEKNGNGSQKPPKNKGRNKDSDGTANATTQTSFNDVVEAVKRSLQQQGGGEKTAEAAHGHGYVMTAKADPRYQESLKDREQVYMLDSGASHHMTCRQDNYINYKAATLAVDVANGERVYAEGYGDIILDCLKDDSVVSIRFNKVWYVPDLDCNLLSITSLKEQQMGVVFEGIGGIVDGLYKNSNKVSSILQSGRVYLLKTTGARSRLYKELCDATASLATEGKDMARVWHRRMGHLGMDNVKKLRDVADGVNFKGSMDCKCDCCLLANQTRSPRNGATSGGATVKGGLIHTDLSGPQDVASLQGNRYTMVIVDDFTRQVQVYFLKTKDEAIHYMKEYQLQQSNAGYPVKAVRNDKGGEYLGITLQTYLKEQGISSEPTVGYSPESNGVAERMNRTLSSKVRAMMKDARLPKFLWEKLTATAAYLHNRSPSRPLGGKTPYEKVNGVKPDLSHLRIIGSKAFVYVPKEKRKGKLTDRGKACILVGYGRGQHIYHVYDPTERQILETRDIVIDEAVGNSNPDESIAEVEEFDEDEDIADASRVPYSSFHREETLEIDATELDRTPPSPEPELRRGERQRRPTRKVIENATANAVLNASAVTGPKNLSYKEAVNGPNGEEWRRVIAAQVEEYVAAKTWEEVRFHPGMNVLSGHWVLVEKPERKKARWVIHGNKQIKGQDYNDVYAAAARSGSIRLLLAITAIEDLETGQLDVIDAFLNAGLAEEVYMTLPHGYGKKGIVCRVLKAMFGLCQSPREWWQDISKKLKELGFKQCLGDHSVYVNEEGVIILLYVDDLALFAQSKRAIAQAKIQLLNAYKMRDIGDLKTFTGIQVLKLPGQRVFIYQEDYAMTILEKYGFLSDKAVRVPFNDKVVLKPRDPLDLCSAATIKQYQEWIGSFGWLTLETRPDMAYAVSKLAQYNANPSLVAIECAKHLFRYLRGTTDWGILYQKDEGMVTIEGYSDSNWGDPNSTDKRSTSGYAFELAGGMISWASRKQRTTATSTAEAEYIAECAATKEAVYLRQFLLELGKSQEGSATLIHGDSTSAIAMAEGLVQPKTRHIEFQYHYTREKVADGTVNFEYIRTDDMVADGMTKPLAWPKFEKFRRQLGMRRLQDVLRG